jgi:tetratricopeptide (TPR) repeat protein
MAISVSVNPRRERRSTSTVETDRRRVMFLAVAVVTAVVALAFRHLGDADFINFDDNLYVTDNPHVQGGLTIGGFLWAWQSTDAGNWHPLTWLSLELDRSLFGAGPRGFHLTNVALHWANSLLVLALAYRLFNSLLAGVLVALLFAVHPLHVESVAWISERKDVLSTFFGLLAILAYCEYSSRPSLKRYAACAAFFVASLLAKPMLVTLPCLLLVFDWWPLARSRKQVNGEDGTSGCGWPWLVAEKLPLLAISIASSLITLAVQDTGGAVRRLQDLTFASRLMNALVGYGFYLQKTVVPTDLALYYPLRNPAPSQAWAWLLCLLLVTAVAVWQCRRRAYLLFGWLWFLGTLVPVIGLVQIGYQAHADRYTYFPLIGVFIAFTGLVAEALALAPAVRKLALVAAFVPVCICMVITARQVGYWHDAESIWRQTLRITADNAYAHYNLANALNARGESNEALDELRESVRLDPTVDARRVYGRLLTQNGRFDQAIEQYRAAADLDADDADTHVGLANLLWLRRRFVEAEQELLRAVALTGGTAELYNKLGELHENQRRLPEALDCFQRAVDIDPNNATYLDCLGRIVARRGNLSRAFDVFEQALRLNPHHAQTLSDVGDALWASGRLAEAAASYWAAVEQRPNKAAYRFQVAVALGELGKHEAARKQIEVGLRLDPHWPTRAAREAWALATAADEGRRDGATAVRLARAACLATAPSRAEQLDILAAAFAEAGRFDDALATASGAVEVAEADGQTVLADAIKKRIEIYRQREAYREKDDQNLIQTGWKDET